MRLSFSYLSGYLESIRDPNHVAELDKLQLIEEYLSDNQELIDKISSFDSYDSKITEPKKDKTVTLRYQKEQIDITDDDNKVAYDISKILKLNYDEVLKVIANQEKSIKKTSIQELAQVVLSERLCIVTSIHAILNNSETPILYNKISTDISVKKEEIFIDLMNLLDDIFEKYGTLRDYQFAEELDSEAKLSEILRIKKKEDMIYITNILRLLVLLSLNSNFNKDIITKWFDVLIRSNDFFDTLVDTDNVPEYIVDKMESLFTINTLLILGLDISTITINNNKHIMQEKELFKFINETLLKNKVNPVISYMWSFILFTKLYLYDEDPISEKLFIDAVFQDQSLQSVISHFAAIAEAQNVFYCIMKLSNSCSTSNFYAAIISSFITLSLNFIEMTVETSEMFKYVLFRTPEEYVEKFLTSDTFEKQILLLKAKLPFVSEALLPLINLSSVNSDFAHYIWKELTVYTTNIKLGELDYDLLDDSSNSDLIITKRDLLVQLPFDTKKNTFLKIPSSTKAKILVSNSSDNVQDSVLFQMNYSGWSLLGNILQSLNELYIHKGYEIDQLGRSTIISIIELITGILKSSGSVDEIQNTVSSLSVNVKEKDIFSVIFNIFEVSLQNRSYQLICSCTDFLLALFRPYPQYVWSYLFKSELLERYGKSSYINSILGSIELSNGEYDFSIKIAKLANLLANDPTAYIGNAVVKTKLDFIEKLSMHLVRIYEGYQFWNYTKIPQRFELGIQCASFFNTILSNFYGTPNHDKEKNMLNTCLSSLAESLLSSHSMDLHSAKSLISTLTSGQNDELSLLTNIAFGKEYTQLINESFKLSITLISTRVTLNLPPSTFEKLVYENSKDLLEIYTSKYYMKNDIICLLNSLIAAPWLGTYPFLLSYLGENNSKTLFNIVCYDLDNPLIGNNILENWYKFIQTLAESKQDGLAALFLTGNIISSSEQKLSENHSIIEILKKNSLKLKSLPDCTSHALLSALLCSLDSWSYGLDKKFDGKFSDLLIEILNESNVTSQKGISTPSDYNSQIYKYKIVTKIVEIFALQLFTGKDNKELISKMFKQKDITLFVQPFFKIKGYNHTLIDTINTGFTQICPGKELKDFVTSPAFKINSSHHSYFNIEYMDKWFSTNPKWNSFKERLLIASSEVDLVSAQEAAAKAWGALLMSYIRASQPDISPNLIDLVLILLKDNLDEINEDFDFTNIFCERLELSFFILFTIQKQSKKIEEQKLMEIFSHLVCIFKSSKISYLDNIPYSTNNNMYRPILRSLLLVLQISKDNSSFVELMSDEIIEFFELCFCKGAHLILAELLTEITNTPKNNSKKTPFNFADRIQDLCFLLSIFKCIKALSPSNDFNKVIASSLNEIGTIKVLLNTYSSSHLFKYDEEPVLGSIALNFIAELCSVAEIAKVFIFNGLFAVLLESPISVAIQQGSLKPETKIKLHNIWSHGLLSIILVLISLFGYKVLAESCLFVSYFTNQIKDTTSSWCYRNLNISSAVIRETSQLILLQKMLNELNYKKFLSESGKTATNKSSGISEVELIIGLDNDDDKRRLNLAFKHFLTHPKFLKSKVVPSTLEERHLVENDSTRDAFVVELTKEIQKLQDSLYNNL
ncbi:hypothetical protein TPHA_0G00980 [Tetrapisispora phaffii CBS 4417]|uniref:Nucleoporin NUP188 n=1 Tax=Tetrapisispora phaffii (strain ATCC 24235 / CBS 4417 / NBRC 1672 / NRRL Y-8282 / UCD 70-5) TaxID=1071381 RepID=G8BVK6_TETPH|nr:hypothetical protein TPHA_0G00980 [Tetrapisispora phaffii CBS 4417]CCE63934.1 hypothetical protein TPHA_0G00980 [Tetrapisispora phaffii CBS 4417]